MDIISASLPRGADMNEQREEEGRHVATLRCGSGRREGNSQRAAGARRPPSSARQPGSVGVSGHDLPRSLLRFGGNFFDYLLRRRRNTRTHRNPQFSFLNSNIFPLLILFNFMGLCAASGWPSFNMLHSVCLLLASGLTTDTDKYTRLS